MTYQRVSLLEQELPTLPENLSVPKGFSGVRVARSSVFCAVFFRSLFVFLLLYIYLVEFKFNVIKFLSNNSLDQMMVTYMNHFEKVLRRHHDVFSQYRCHKLLGCVPFS